MFIALSVLTVSPLVFVFSSRGLFAGHYTETHYLEDGSAVSSAHNSTVGPAQRSP